MIKVEKWGPQNQYSTVPVLVRVSDRTIFTIEDGQCVLYVTEAMSTIGKDMVKNHLTRYIDAYINTLGDDTFIRVTHYAEDYSHLENGTHRGSINHATDEAEGGLSVAKSPEFPAKYAYYVTGKVIGQGTDGEPLLDIKTAKPASKLMTYKQIENNYSKKLEKRLGKLGLTKEEYKAIKSGAKLIWGSK